MILFVQNLNRVYLSGMKAQVINYRGTTINAIWFSDMEAALEAKGFDINTIFSLIADEKEKCYVSNGFIRGLHSDNEIGEWHHYFVKEADGTFEARKLQFK